MSEYKVVVMADDNFLVVQTIYANRKETVSFPLRPYEDVWPMEGDLEFLYEQF